MAKRNEPDYKAELDKAYERWNDLAVNGCADPFWSDGVNMGLVRKHILYYRNKLRWSQEQISMFDTYEDSRPVPAEISPKVMIRGGRYSDRVSRLCTLHGEDVIWVDSGALCV